MLAFQSWITHHAYSINFKLDYQIHQVWVFFPGSMFYLRSLLHWTVVHTVYLILFNHWLYCIQVLLLLHNYKSSPFLSLLFTSWIVSSMSSSDQKDPILVQQICWYWIYQCISDSFIFHNAELYCVHAFTFQLPTVILSAGLDLPKGFNQAIS